MYNNFWLQWVDEPTLLVTRFEYANLFHTVTDWYSAYVSSRVTNLPNLPNVVFVDGHCKVRSHILSYSFVPSNDFSINITFYSD